MAALLEADYKVNNSDNISGTISSSNNSSSEDDGGILVSKEMIQLVKMETNIEKSLSKIKSFRHKLQDENLHLNEETQFEILLLKVTNDIKALSNGNAHPSNIDLKSLKAENKEIRKLFQDNKKVWQDAVKQEKLIKKQEKQLLKEQKKNEKIAKSGNDNKPNKPGKGMKGIKKNKVIDPEKSKAKEEKAALKVIKKLEKEKKKEEKRIFLTKLEAARIEQLPNDLSNIELWIDGWNISGCFGGRSRSKSKLIDLLQSFYSTNTSNDDEKSNGLTKNIELFYDGNGKDKFDGNINVNHSGKDVIVDDLWVDILSKMNIIRKNTIICVTSDRELTVRLYNIGVTVIKSGTFFKGYLKPLLEGSNNSTDNINQSNDNDFVMVNNDNINQ